MAREAAEGWVAGWALEVRWEVAKAGMEQWGGGGRCRWLKNEDKNSGRRGKE